MASKTASQGKLIVRSKILGRLLRLGKSPVGKVLAALILIVAVAAGVTFNHFYWQYAKIIDARLQGGPFNQTSKILAAPDPVFVGDQTSIDGIISHLREAGYSESRHNQVGHFSVKPDAIEVYPGVLSYFMQEPAVLYFSEGRVSRIVSLNDNNPQNAYELEPKLITNLFDADRSKRRLVAYDDIPAVLRNAVLSIEDHRFFEHSGIDFIRTTRAALDGIAEWRRPRGTSTLTQQLARQFFLKPEQTYKRKIEELMISMQLESRLSKEQIFEFYANQIPLGRRGSFNVMGMGEASEAYFDKDIRALNLHEAAMLAGLIQRPSFLNPYRHPERAKSRRDTVLQAMLREGYISTDEFRAAVAQPIDLAHGKIEYSTAPYFVDLVNRELRPHFGEEELITQSYRVYTTLDMELQKAAHDAIQVAMADVDKKVAQQHKRGKYAAFGYPSSGPAPQAQAALVAIDPATGEVKAIVGGRNYGDSQLNRVLAYRQPGSAFKPFVYAAAINTAIERADNPLTPASHPVMTPISTVDDVPTTFWWDDKPYEPSNFSNKIYGEVTMREALIKSMNIATVKVAEIAGWEGVSELAKRAGLGENIQPTPAIALGAYEVTPLDIAAAYTVFANQGVRMEPYFIRSVADTSGNVLHRNTPKQSQVLDPRVAYIVTHMLEDVIRKGTAVRVRAMGFTEPAAGKTGTDDDGWFAGYTTKLVCVAWVGFDDNTDLALEGAHSALPIWAEFMKRAHALREYRNPEPFKPVDGIVTAEIDPETYELGTYACPKRTTEVFIAGSQPNRYCRLHGGEGKELLLATNVAGWDSEGAEASASGETGIATGIEQPQILPPSITIPLLDPRSDDVRQPAEDKKKKKGFFGRILDVFK
ncbi:MAG TPA: PBP1A family penicillin-binding protein [Bryobacterales bacterium]|nr:PBP1A family penicillin-binding protein [Bryobacterales bacterium]